MNNDPKHAPHRWLFERIPDVCLIETDASGVLTWFGPSAEAFFQCPAEEAVGRLHYGTFHDAEEMKACQDDPDFRSKMEANGWTEEDWTIVPREGARFRARVTLVRKAGGEGAPPEAKTGWIALYRRLPEA